MVRFRSDEDVPKTKTPVTRDPIIGVIPKSSAHLLNMIQAQLPGASVPTPEPARARAFVALGKLCLRDERFTKEGLNFLPLLLLEPRLPTRKYAASWWVATIGVRQDS
jgi:hypothetical protein